jgi:hypothetical protein
VIGNAHNLGALMFRDGGNNDSASVDTVADSTQKLLAERPALSRRIAGASSSHGIYEGQSEHNVFHDKC